MMHNFNTLFFLKEDIIYEQLHTSNLLKLKTIIQINQLSHK